MEVLISSLLILLVMLLPFSLIQKRRASARLPPGSMGLPIIGHSLTVMKAMRTNKAEDWFKERIRKYGPISKLSLFGTRSVFIHGPAANKFFYTYDGNTLSNKQPSSISRIMGEKNIFELIGDDHKRVRAALMSFLKHEVLKQYVPKMDEEIRNHIKMHWHGKEEVKVMPLMKNLTFNIICSLIFGIEQGKKRDQLINLFNEMIKGVLTVPINLPFTQFRRSLQARERLKPIIMDLIREKRLTLEEHGASSNQDLITCLVSIRNEDGSQLMSDEEILDNVTTVMAAGHDTTSVLLNFLVRLLAENPSIYSAIVDEQEEIAKSKSSGEPLTWNDLNKMKYTWMIAKETLRMTPPVFFSFRRALKDIEYMGYTIPKGWQVVLVANMTHMDEKIYPDPLKFDPKRFEQQPAAPFSFVAFGGGQRICPGYEFAKMETLAMIHYLVTHYTWKLTLKDNSFKRDPKPNFKQGQPIQISPKTSDD